MLQGFDLNSAAASVDAAAAAAAATTHNHHHHNHTPPPPLQQLQDIRYLNMLPLYHSTAAPSSNEYVLCGKMQASCGGAGESRQQANSSCSSSAGGSGGRGTQGSGAEVEEEEEGWGRTRAGGGGGGVNSNKKAATRKNSGRKKVMEGEERMRFQAAATAEEEAGIGVAGGNSSTSNTTNNNKYVRYSREQVDALERVYRQCPKPSLQQRLELLRQFPALASVDPHQIKVWFQNRRCREKQRKESARLQTLNGKLTAMNTMLMDENLQLQQHVAHLLHQNQLLRHQLLHLHKATPPNPPPASLHDNHLHNQRHPAGSPHQIGHHTTTSLFPDPHILNLSRQSPSDS